MRGQGITGGFFARQGPRTEKKGDLLHRCSPRAERERRERRRIEFHSLNKKKGVIPNRGGEIENSRAPAGRREGGEEGKVAF